MIILTGDKAVITNEMCELKCDLAFRSIGYQSVQAEPDVPFDEVSSTVPQNIGRVDKFLLEMLIVP